MRQFDSDLLLRIDVTSKELGKETIFDILQKIRPRDDAIKSFYNEVLGRTILTSYNNKTYYVNDVDFTLNPNSTFTLRNGETTTYVDYYRQKYNITIRHMNQPMLISSPKERVRDRNSSLSIYALVPELCQLFGIPLEILNDTR